MSSTALSYAAVILADADVEITADKLLALTNAANVEDIEPIYAQLHASALSKANTKELLTAFGSTAAPTTGGVAAAGEAAAGDAGEAAEEKKAEAAEESDDMDMGMLF